MNVNGYNLIAALALVGAVAVALAGNGNADDLLAASLVGLDGTSPGRGPKASA